jgi:large subunit ribosomal protein L32e
MKKLLELRKAIKANKPNFVRQDSNKEKHKNKNKWRKPRGLHNKLRLKKKGHIKTPSVGYKSPILVKGLHSSGLSFYKVNNFKDLEGLDKEKQIPVISSKLGLKKKIQILEKCLSENIKVLNIKDIKTYLEKTKKNLVKEKEEARKKQEVKKKKQEKIIKNKEKKKEKKQEEIKKDILKSKPEAKNTTKQIDDSKKSNIDSKKGHMASSIPGGKK